MRYDEHCQQGKEVALLIPNGDQYSFLVAETDSVDMNGVLDYLKRTDPLETWSSIDDIEVLEKLSELMLNMSTTLEEVQEDPVVT
ncbi:hypothetical protein [Breoghania sp.]|uniref:hypothetical protein n=1 Tax=Breoghania sp. TaxID=2065378 RepID=UPI00261B8CB4|nr:hypothetical protein [Breoghania sp.]MDJ0931000.1 hypothetical protein [Breoghania sp.]